MLKTTIEVQIFDDPKYCDMCWDENDKRPCPHLLLEEEICTAFTVSECFIKLDFDYEEAAFIKHERCVAAWENQTNLNNGLKIH